MRQCKKNGMCPHLVLRAHYCLANKSHKCIGVFGTISLTETQCQQASVLEVVHEASNPVGIAVYFVNGRNGKYSHCCIIHYALLVATRMHWLPVDERCSTQLTLIWRKWCSDCMLYDRLTWWFNMIDMLSVLYKTAYHDHDKMHMIRYNLLTMKAFGKWISQWKYIEVAF